MSSPQKETEVPTRTKLLDAAEELMLSRGYVATTVDAVCSAAGVTKGSFFHYFKNKEELGKVLLGRFAERQRDGFLAACATIDDPLDRVYEIIDCAIASTQDPAMKGCLIGTVAQEISETHPELRQVCQASFQSFAARLGDDLLAAKERHRPDAEFDAASLGPHFLAIAQGSMLLFKATGDRTVMQRGLTHFRAYLKVLYGR